jgi:nucleoside-diphosphate-sugar epimerase
LHLRLIFFSILWLLWKFLLLYYKLTGEIEEVVNCAADLGFGQTRQRFWLTNVGGTQNLLELARLLGAGRFHHFSSAYVCGKKEGVRQQYRTNLNTVTMGGGRSV